MTRVGTFAQSQVLTSELLRLNQQQFRTQQQIATGKVAQTFQEIPQDTTALLSAKGVEAKLTLYSRTSEEVKNRLELQDIQLTALAGFADDLRQSMTSAVATDSGIVTMEELDNVFRGAVNILNSQLDGKFLYGGTRTDTRPVTSDSLETLRLAASADDLFVNNSLKASAQIDDHASVEYGVLADELGGNLFAAIKRIAEFNAGPNGPFADTLTPAQKTYLESELATLRTISQGIESEVASNGLKLAEIDTTIDRHKTGDIFIKGLISDIEDVDLAEAVSRLNNDQLAVEASTRVLAQLGRLSLLDFI